MRSVSAGGVRVSTGMPAFGQRGRGGKGRRQDRKQVRQPFHRRVSLDRSPFDMREKQPPCQIVRNCPNFFIGNGLCERAWIASDETSRRCHQNDVGGAPNGFAGAEPRLHPRPRRRSGRRNSRRVSPRWGELFGMLAIMGFFVRGQGLAPWSFTLASRSKVAAIPSSVSPRRLPKAACEATRTKAGEPGSLRM